MLSYCKTPLVLSLINKSNVSSFIRGHPPHPRHLELSFGSPYGITICLHPPHPRHLGLSFGSPCGITICLISLDLGIILQDDKSQGLITDGEDAGNCNSPMLQLPNHDTNGVSQTKNSKWKSSMLHWLTIITHAMKRYSPQSISMRWVISWHDSASHHSEWWKSSVLCQLTITTDAMKRYSPQSVTSLWWFITWHGSVSHHFEWWKSLGCTGLQSPLMSWRGRRHNLPACDDS